MLVRHRLASGLTQEQLAERSGLSVNAVSLLERGARTSPRTSTVTALARALDLDRAERQVFVAAARRKPGAAGLVRVPPPDLRAPPTRLVGRACELAQARLLLARSGVRMLTLTGPPGSGKTRLAFEVARDLEDHYADGVAFVTLGPIGDPSLVMPAVRAALGLREASC